MCGYTNVVVWCAIISAAQMMDAYTSVWLGCGMQSELCGFLKVRMMKA